MRSHTIRVVPIDTPLEKFQKVKRWNMCQSIAQVLYRSARTDEELLRIHSNYFDLLYGTCGPSQNEEIKKVTK